MLVLCGKVTIFRYAGEVAVLSANACSGRLLSVKICCAGSNGLLAVRGVVTISSRRRRTLSRWKEMDHVRSGSFLAHRLLAAPLVLGVVDSFPSVGSRLFRVELMQKSDPLYVFCVRFLLVLITTLHSSIFVKMAVEPLRYVERTDSLVAWNYSLIATFR